MQLCDENFELFAAKHYDMRSSTSFEEFQQDLKKVTYIKKLFGRYSERDDLQLRLLLNHIVIFYNCFGSEATPMLFMKLEGHHHLLKPFLIFLNRLPKKVEYSDKTINTNEIVGDDFILEQLRNI